MLIDTMITKMRQYDSTRIKCDMLGFHDPTIAFSSRRVLLIVVSWFRVSYLELFLSNYRTVVLLQFHYRDIVLSSSLFSHFYHRTVALCTANQRHVLPVPFMSSIYQRPPDTVLYGPTKWNQTSFTFPIQHGVSGCTLTVAHPCVTSLIWTSTLSVASTHGWNQNITLYKYQHIQIQENFLLW